MSRRVNQYSSRNRPKVVHHYHYHYYMDQPPMHTPPLSPRATRRQMKSDDRHDNNNNAMEESRTDSVESGQSWKQHLRPNIVSPTTQGSFTPHTQRGPVLSSPQAKHKTTLFESSSSQQQTTKPQVPYLPIPKDRTQPHSAVSPRRYQQPKSSPNPTDSFYRYHLLEQQCNFLRDKFIEHYHRVHKLE